MKKLIIFYLTLILPIICFSQNTVEITSEQLQTTNLIFLEHEKYKEEIPLLQSKIRNLEKIDSNWCVIDSLRRQELDLCHDNLYKQESRLNELQDNLNKTKNITKYTIFGSVLVIILTCLLK